MILPQTKLEQNWLSTMHFYGTICIVRNFLCEMDFTMLHNFRMIMQVMNCL